MTQVDLLAIKDGADVRVTDVGPVLGFVRGLAWVIWPETRRTREDHTGEGGVRIRPWACLEGDLGPVAARLRELKETLDLFPLLKVSAFTKAFTQLLRQKLFIPSSLFPSEASDDELLTITYSLIDDRVLIDLQQAAFAIGLPKPRREPVQREAIMEKRDKTIYKAARAGKPYRQIQALVRQKYPSSQNLGYLHVTVSRIFQIAQEYAERHGLRRPKARHHRRG
jgi:hypothetical protein